MRLSGVLTANAAGNAQRYDPTIKKNPRAPHAATYGSSDYHRISPENNQMTDMQLGGHFSLRQETLISLHKSHTRAEALRVLHLGNCITDDHAIARA